MPQPSLLPGGPLAAAAALLEEAPPPPVDPASFLADLVDLAGGVSLADALAGLDPPPAPADPPMAPEALQAQVRAEVARIDERLAEALAFAFRPRYRLPGPARAFSILEQAGALRVRKGRPVQVATRTLWAPFGDFLETHLKRARFALRDLRIELGPALAAQGQDALRLERLDAALSAATHAAVERLYRRALAAVEAAFASGLKQALRDLPAEPGVDDLAAGFAEGGWVRAAPAAGQQLVRAIVEHERAHLLALVRAAI